MRALTRSTDALEAFEADPQAFDLVITDLTMPRMTGDVLARRVRRVRPDIPVILCTGYSKTTTEDKAAAAGVAELLRKPLSLGRISKVIRRVLDRN